MEQVKENLNRTLVYMKAFFKWILIALAVGIIGGLLGTVFHMSVDAVTELREHHAAVLYLLPLGGVVIVGLYKLFSAKRQLDTNRVIEAVRKNKKIPIVMIPLIFISTVISHMLGASVGREGAALQLGGSIGYNFGKVLRLNEKDMHIIIMAGMSAVFSALFGTPLTAAVFSLEVTSVGVLHYAGLLPCMVAAVMAYAVSMYFGITPVSFRVAFPDTFSVVLAVKVVALALLCAGVSIVFLTAIKLCEHYMDKLIKNSYIRAFAGGMVIVLFTLLLGNRDYNGAGMDVITRAMSGEARAEAFILKIIFTAISISAGFKGGEIVPSFFIGTTFGCVMSHFLGIDASLAAAVGFVSLFCCVVNCPIASLLLSIEVFGGVGIIYFAAACAVSYMMSGSFGLYKSQKIVYSKLDDEYIDIHAK